MHRMQKAGAFSQSVVFCLGWLLHSFVEAFCTR
jgi:hypothetical protein